MSEPTIFAGGLACDDRGTLSFVNNFDLKNIRRFYQVENNDTSVIRAFHGHLKEAKYAYVVKGSAKLVMFKLDASGKPEKNFKETAKQFCVNAKQPCIVHIPEGYANGFKALERGTIIIFFSTGTLEESKNDDYRFSWDMLGKDIWETKNR